MKSFIYRSDFASFDWPGGDAIEVAEVRVILNDLALHFHAPMHLDGNSLSIVLATGDNGPLLVTGEIIEERDLFASEIGEFGFSFMSLNLFIGRSANLDSAKSFVNKEFPPWAQVYFFDEYTNGRPGPKPYSGPSS